MGGAPVIETIRDGVQFEPGAAASFRRAEAALGRRIDVNSSYRDYDKQLSMYTAWNRYVASGYNPALYPGHSRAIHPGYSMHCKGLAVDSDDWATSGFNAFMEDRGWIRTAASDPTERHHFEYQWWNDQYRNEPAPAGKEDIMNPNQEAKLDQAVSIISVVKQLLTETQQWQGIGVLVSETYKNVGIIRQLISETEQWDGMDNRLSKVLGAVSQLQAAIAEGEARDAARDAALEAAVRALASGTGIDPAELSRIVQAAAQGGAAASLAAADFPTEKSIAQAVVTQQERARLATLEAEVARLQGELDQARNINEL